MSDFSVHLKDAAESNSATPAQTDSSEDLASF